MAAKKSTKSKGKFTVAVEKPAKDTDSKPMETENEDEYDIKHATSTKRRSQQTKRNRTADQESFAESMASILAQPTAGATAPIMAKNRKREEQIKEEIITYRARKALAEEKRSLLNKDRVIPSITDNYEYERKLRKVATRGVIKLFNVVKAQQTELTDISHTPSVRSEKVAEMSKSKFLDLLKTSS